MNGQNDNLINPEVLQPREVAKLPNTTIQVDTPAGAAWSRKYLHPPCATSGDYAGYPDANNSPSTDAEYKGLVDIQTFRVNDKTTDIFNKVLLLHTSSAIAPVITFTQSLTGNVTQYGEDVVLNRNINVTDMVLQNASGRLTYKSTTSWLNATSFNNQGNVTTGQFRPNILRLPVGDLIKVFDRLYADNPERQCQLLGNLIKFYHPEASSYEIIGVTSTKGARVTDVDVRRAKDMLTFDVDNTVQVLQVGLIPMDPSQILMMSPNAVAESAKEGSFVVQRFCQPEIPYKDFAANGVKGGVSSPIGMPCYIWQSPTATTGVITEIGVINQPGNKTQVLADLPWFDFLWGWTLYEGLSVTATTAPSGVTPPYISVKTITGFEFQPLPDSMLSPFIRNCAVYDMSALRFATTTNHAIPDSLPSAANFWGSLGKILLQAAPTVIDTVSSLFGKERTSKQKKLTNDTVKSLTEKIKSMETKFSKKERQPRQQQQPQKQRRPRAKFIGPMLPPNWSQWAQPKPQTAPKPKPQRPRKPRQRRNSN